MPTGPYLSGASRGADGVEGGGRWRFAVTDFHRGQNYWILGGRRKITCVIMMTTE